MTRSEEQKQRFFAEGHSLPKCLNDGCNNDIAVREWKNWSFKAECNACISARKKGKERPGVTKHKKEYCENIDGHLGFKCPVPTKEDWEFFQCSLDLDHTDGDKYNNTPTNVRTICKACHCRKSIEWGDCNSNKESAKQFN